MRVLFVKLTSMGDLIHALPALTDAKRARPDIIFDWAIDKNFSEVATWHPAVQGVLRTSHRKWKKQFWQSIQTGEIQQFFKSLREHKYDLVIDGQNNTKSAVITLLSKGIRCGLDKASAREWLAPFAYQKKYSVARDLHAIKRLRLLLSQVLEYPFQEDQPDYGIADYPFPALSFPLPKSYVVFVHNASWDSKMWPEASWQQLTQLAAKDNLAVLFPWGNKTEKERAERIAVKQDNAIVLPFCSLSEHASILKGSQGAICSDTGLSHLAAALNVPAVTMYGSTSADLIGTTGLHQEHLISPFPCIKCYKYHCDYQQQRHSEPLCLTAIHPEMLWEKLNLMRKPA